MVIRLGTSLYLYFHGWKTLSWKNVDIPVDFKETIVCFGFCTIHYERFVW